MPDLTKYNISICVGPYLIICIIFYIFILFALQKVLFSIAGSFIYYANHFKLYSSFCASHSRAQKVLSPGENAELYEFLHARNPKQQHSATLESYLIKPIQRILKYPLLLQQLKGLTDTDSNEYTHLRWAGLLVDRALGSNERTDVWVYNTMLSIRFRVTI